MNEFELVSKGKEKVIGICRITCFYDMLLLFIMWNNRSQLLTNGYASTWIQKSENFISILLISAFSSVKIIQWIKDAKGLKKAMNKSRHMTTGCNTVLCNEGLLCKWINH